MDHQTREPFQVVHRLGRGLCRAESRRLLSLASLKHCADDQEAMRQNGQLTPGPKIGDILKETEPASPPAGGKTATVILDVKVYDKPDDPKVKIGDLRAGTQGVILAEPCRADNWCHLTGNVPTGDGWSWSGPGYKSLKP